MVSRRASLWASCRDEHNDILAVADWGQRLSFYQLSGKQVKGFGGGDDTSDHMFELQPARMGASGRSVVWGGGSGGFKAHRSSSARSLRA